MFSSISRQASKGQLTRLFSSSSPRLVKVGDKIPQIPLALESPGNQFVLANEIKSGKALIVGVPGAFSPGCTASHIPGYLENFSKFSGKGFNKVFFVAVNDAFVVDAWSKSFANVPEGVTFLADPKGEFVDALDLKFDASAFFGNERSKRFALAVENGSVIGAFVEPENTPVDVSEATKVLSQI
ncbi:peroxiredoxin Ahp1 [Yamadazyma tenuis]|uniref:Redoxin n=1 Tax=Candida tenuis (strain ATCC 10573 / BCRC 21748 / CBS 615 / JCM 9827 / NBRC 10315 / NRRL Y-1498 / VKM Y-70) TaxID=590646 RepID=G3B845_CANTC|nr:Redoxin [Yamadazyma tenuis ATCC 10573]XP_006689046.1 uncharacterized protein CANTEDRAFT_115809 [Yamadazyma tenuis ATCC 10573]EGV62875.1 Redoxin [Yamadazyma tenuis ATCC 10573]EGV62876.1 hypothetical protein CANTEDRAFT_115809 [Yamadazyma tenuis ATCC 10573]WEJ93611.1 peroxiredoxin Ahp1 [Yamadazyma tenuis]